MNKTQRKLEAIIITQQDDIDYLTGMLQSEEKLTLDLMKQADKAEERAAAAIDAATKQIAESRKQISAEKKAATEAATLKAIREGYLPISVLRDHVSADYSTTHNATYTKTDLTVMLDNKQPVDKAILAALLEKPAPKMTGYASGGYTGANRLSDPDWINQYLYGGMSPADLLAPATTKTHLHYNPSIITPGVVA